jgi:hypothetical protein
MPLLKGKKNIGHNVKEMENAGHSMAQSVAAALKTAGVPKARDGVVARALHAMQDWAKDAFNESDHPRDPTGKFGAGSGSRIQEGMATVSFTETPPFVTHFLNRHISMGSGEKYLKTVPAEKLLTAKKLLSETRDRSTETSSVRRMVFNELKARGMSTDGREATDIQLGLVTAPNAGAPAYRPAEDGSFSAGDMWPGRRV